MKDNWLKRLFGKAADPIPDLPIAPAKTPDPPPEVKRSHHKKVVPLVAKLAKLVKPRSHHKKED